MPFPVEEKYIKETEVALDVTFPPLFKQKMIERNGGGAYSNEKDIDFQLHPFLDKSNKKRISRTCNHIILETKKAKKDLPFIPPNSINIGSDAYGNLILLLHGTDKNLKDDLYLFDLQYRELSKIADSIFEFDFE